MVLRLHPEERKDEYLRQFSKDNRIHIDIPDDGFRATLTSDFGDKKSVYNFLELMKFSDVVINLASTITLDATLFDTPVICPTFNLKLPKNSWNAAENWYHSSHFSEITKSGAVSLANNMSELIYEIDDILINPDRRQKERNELCEKMMPNLPTSELIEESIKQLL